MSAAAEVRRSAATDWAFSANRLPYSVVSSAARCAAGPALTAAMAASSAAFAPISLATGAAWVAMPLIIDWSWAIHSRASGVACAPSSASGAAVDSLPGSSAGGVSLGNWSVIGTASSRTGARVRVTGRAALSHGIAIRPRADRPAARYSSDSGSTSTLHGAPGAGSSSATGSAPRSTTLNRHRSPRRAT